MTDDSSAATKKDVNELRDEMRGQITEVRGQITEVRDQITGEMHALRDQLVEQMRDMQTEVLRAFHDWASPVEINFVPSRRSTKGWA